MMVGKLGRWPTKHDARNIPFRAIFNLSTMPARPAARDWGQKDGRDVAYPMLGNDEYGDCAYASIVHDGLTLSTQTDAPITVTSKEVIDRYLADTGGDNGAYMLEVVKSIIRKPLGGLVIDAFVEIDPTDDDAFEAAQEFFGGVWCGWALPRAWQGADVWDVGPNTSGIWAPWSWGGHATDSPTYSPGGGGLITWMQRQPYTHPARRSYCEESYGIFSRKLWLGLAQNCPAGVDYQKLLDLLTRIRRQ